MINPKIIDLSKWNGPMDLKIPAMQDWDMAKSNNVVGAILRIGSIDMTTGACYKDSRVDEFVKGAVAAKMPIGYYFYTRPRFSGVLQADYVLDLLKDMPMDLDFWIDVEEAGINPAQARDSIKAMASKLRDAFGTRVGIYTRQSFWDANVAQDPMWGSLKLWAARWSNALSGPWSDNSFKFRDWTNWKIWQYSADTNNLAAQYGFGNGETSMDLNYFNGSKDDFLNEYSIHPTISLEERLSLIETEIANLEVRVLRLESGVPLVPPRRNIIDPF